MWYKKDDPPPLTPQEQKEFKYFIGNVIYGMNQKKNGVWSMGNFYEHIIHTFKKLKMTSEVIEYQRMLSKWNSNNKQGETQWK